MGCLHGRRRDPDPRHRRLDAIILTVLVYVLGLACIGFAIAVMERGRRFRAPALHIWLVASSYVALAVLTMSVVEDVEDQLWASASFLAGIGSLITMIRHYRR